MTFQCPVGPPPDTESGLAEWSKRWWNWIARSWFIKQRALGNGLEYDSLDQVQVDETVVPTIPVQLTEIQDIATDTVLGRDTAGSGPVEQIGLGASIIMSGGGFLIRAALTGDITASEDGNATTLANNAATNTVLRDSGALSVIGRSANSAGDPADISASAASGAVLRESGSTIGFGTVATAGLANGSVTNGKLRDSTGRSVIGKTGSGTGSPGDIVAAADGQILGRFGGFVSFVTPVTDLLVHQEDMKGRVLTGTVAGATPTLAMADPVVVSTSAEAWFAAVLCLDGNVTWTAFRFAIPTEIDTAYEITVEADFILNSAGSGALVNLTCKWGAFFDNDSSAAPGVTGSFATIVDVDSYAGGAVVHTIFSGGMTTSYAGAKYIQGVIERDARVGNGDDTYADIIGLSLVRFNGKRLIA